MIALEGTGDGSIMIGGDFTGVGGKFHQSLARLNWDGSTDHSFVANVDGVVSSLRLRDDKLLLAGHFGMALGVGRTSLARLNTDYSLDNSFNPKVTKADGTLAGIRMADVDDSGLIIIGGHFDTINGSAQHRNRPPPQHRRPGYQLHLHNPLGFILYQGKRRRQDGRHVCDSRESYL